jgi:allantoin racemase
MRLLLLLNGSRTRYAGGAGEARLRVWREYVSAGTQLEIGHLPDEAEIFPFGRGNALTHANLYPDRCAQAEADGFDAVIIHCCSDPGLAEARHRVRIPIVGPGEVTLRAGALLGHRIGMTVPSDESLEAHLSQVRALGLEQQVVGIQPIRRAVGEYAKQDPRALTDALAEAARQLVVDRGADVICPSGLAYIPVRVSAREVTERLGVPVLDPAFLAVRTAEMLVEARSRTPVAV